MPKYRITKEDTGFGGNTTVWEKVEEIDDLEEAPENAEEVPEDTKTHDWELQAPPLKAGRR